jgi:uncharacterized protein (TIGR00369 family)
MMGRFIRDIRYRMGDAVAMKQFNPAYFRAVAGQVNASPYYLLTSMSITDIGPGRCVMEAPVQTKHFQPYGMVHGGMYASLVDAAAYWAVFTEIDEGLKMISIDLKINYLGSASEGVLIAEGKSIKAGKTLCIGEATVVNEKGRLLAHGTSTMMVLKDLEIKGKFDLPPKYM